MKKRWVKRKMNKALTMITLTSTMALMSPMIVQTGSIVYAVSQDQATILADTEVGKLAYTYQTDETNINWSLSVDEKSAAESAYLRLKIDGIDTINVAGQSIGKDETGWFVLDAATGGANAYQVDFATINNGSQELPIAAELITPGEEDVEDQVQSLVTDGMLKAEVPVVTELPEVETSPTESLDEVDDGESNAGDVGDDAGNVVVEEEQEEPPVDVEPDVVDGNVNVEENTEDNVAVAADEGAVEVSPFGVSTNTHKPATSAGGTDISVGVREDIGEKYAEAGQKVTFTSSFTLAYYSNHRNYQWSATLNSNTMAFTNNQNIAVEYLSEDGWKSLGTATVDSDGNLSKLNLPIQPTNSNKSVAYTVRITVPTKTNLADDIKGTFKSSVHYQERWSSQHNWQDAMPNTNYTYYWVRGNVLRLRNEVTTGDKDLVTTATSIVEGITPYANPGDEVNLTSKFTLPSDTHTKQYQNFKWTATLDLQTLDVLVRDTVRVLLYWGDNRSTHKDVRIKAGGVIEPDFTFSSRGEYTCKIVTTSGENLKIKNTGVTSDLRGVFTSKVAYQTRTRIWNSWGNWSDATPVSKKSNYWVKANPVPIDNPTYLSWKEIGEDNVVTTSLQEIFSSHYDDFSAGFYWKDLDGSEDITFKLFLNGDIKQEFTGASGETSEWIRFTIKNSELIENRYNNLVEIKAYKDDMEIEGAKHLSRRITLDSPTVLSWSDLDEDVQEKKQDSLDLAAIDSEYKKDFFWSDADTSAEGRYKQGLDETELLVVRSLDAENVSGTAALASDGTGTLTIMATELTEGTHTFIIVPKRTDYDGISGNMITITITVSTSIKLISVPSTLSWSGTVDQMTGIVNRKVTEEDNGSMKVVVRDSRQEPEDPSKKNDFSVTASFTSEPSVPFDLVWKTDEAIDLDKMILKKANFSPDDKGYTFSREQDYDSGILLKAEGHIPVGDYSGTITWSLDQTPETS